jgi:site-specific DNA-methyltransferase (adenine-specific)
MGISELYEIMNYPNDFINTILRGDCLDILKYVPDESIDFCITSPPYDRQRDYQGYDLDLHLLGEEIFRVLRNGSVCVMVIQDQTKDFRKSLTSFRTIIDWCDNFGFGLFETCIYKRSGVPGNWWSKRFRVDHEYIPIFLKGKRPRYFNKEHMKIDANQAGKKKKGKERRNDGSFTKYKFNPTRYPKKKCSGTILDYEASRASDKSLKINHPAWFPQKLAEDFILCFTEENDVVLDPLIGSGTTAVASKNHNRKFIGIEVSNDYCRVAKQRVAEI